jgi:hypothetical protein
MATGQPEQQGDFREYATGAPADTTTWTNPGQADWVQVIGAGTTVVVTEAGQTRTITTDAAEPGAVIAGSFKAFTSTTATRVRMGRGDPPALALPVNTAPSAAILPLTIPMVIATNEATSETTDQVIGAFSFDPSTNVPATGAIIRTLKLIATMHVSDVGQTATATLHNQTDAVDVGVLASTSLIPERQEIALTVPGDLPNSQKDYLLKLRRTGGAATDVFVKHARIDTFFT